MKVVHLVRGDSARATLISAGIKYDEIAVFHDSLSWGPVPQGNIDLPRAEFWSSLGIPCPSDRRLIEEVASRSDVSCAVWPESFLDSTLFAVWAVVSLSKQNVPGDRILVPATLRNEFLFIGDSPAEAVKHAALVPVGELIARERLFGLWGAYAGGRLRELHAQVAAFAGDGSRWLLPLQFFVDRIPNLPKQLPPIVEELLEDLAGQSEAQPISRVVGRMLLRRHRKPGMLDTDIMVFRLIRELVEPPNPLFEIRKTLARDYPVAHKVELSSAGRRALESGTSFRIGTSSLLRWIGGCDQAGTPVSFDPQGNRVLEA